MSSLYGGANTGERVRTRHLLKAKEQGEKWAMLTSYDQYTARIFDEVGIPALLVGDSAANNVFGYGTTLPVTVDELLPLVRAVVKATRRTMVIGDLPFGSYEEGAVQALRTAIRFMKETECHAVKLEGARPTQIESIVGAGVPVMAHLGFTPQSEHQIGGYRVAGRTADAASTLMQQARDVYEAGAFALVLEMVPADVAKQITAELPIPTVGIGAGPDTDAQVLVWQDMAGLRDEPNMPRFVKKYADLAGVLRNAAKEFADEVRDSAFPAQEHSF